MVRAIAISMPRFPALRLAVKVACNAAQLWPMTGGQFTLSELLQLYGHNQQAAEGLRDVVTCMCYSTQGQIARWVLVWGCMGVGVWERECVCLGADGRRDSFEMGQFCLCLREG